MWSFFSRDPLREFQYEILEKLYSLDSESVFCLHRGKSKATGNDVSIFIHVRSENIEEWEIAKSTVKRLKTLRHPSILIYLDSHETENHIYLATEFVRPLMAVLDEFENSLKRQFYFSWGIMEVMRAVGFMNKDASLRHNNIFCGAVFVNNAGEWKVGEVSYVTAIDDPFPQKVMKSLSRYSPPEIIDGIILSTWSVDSWGLGVLIWEIFNRKMQRKSDLQFIEKIPKALVGVYCELVAANPSGRPEANQVIKRCSQKNGYFNNALVTSLLFLEEIQIKDKQQTSQFFDDLVSLIEHFPENLCRQRLLPQLLNAFEFGEAGVSVLTPLLKIGNLMADRDYEKLIAPCIIKLFESNDRATRCKLLQEISNFIGKIPSDMVNQKIFPLVAHGFLDTNAVVREFTVKSIVELAPKLVPNNLNIEVLKHLARIQSKDNQNSIRTNTTVCLGKIAPYIQSQVRRKVLLSAFIRALHDPFPPARVAGILALVSCQQFFMLQDIAERVLPALCALTVDSDTSVRENVFRAIKGFLGKLEKVSENPDLKTEMENEVSSTMTTMKKGASWAEWAVSAISFKLRSEVEDEKKTLQSLSGKNSNNQGPVGSIEFQEDVQNDMEAQSEQKPHTPSLKKFHEEDNRTSEHSEGWDVEDWGLLDCNDQTGAANTEYKGEPQHFDPFPLNTGQRKNEKVSKRCQEVKDSEKNKHRQSGPLKLGQKCHS